MARRRQKLGELLKVLHQQDGCSAPRMVCNSVLISKTTSHTPQVHVEAIGEAELH